MGHVGEGAGDANSEDEAESGFLEDAAGFGGGGVWGGGGWHGGDVGGMKAEVK